MKVKIIVLRFGWIECEIFANYRFIDSIESYPLSSVLNKYIANDSDAEAMAVFERRIFGILFGEYEDFKQHKSEFKWDVCRPVFVISLVDLIWEPLKLFWLQLNNTILFENELKR